MRFGDRLRQLRLEKDETQRKVAEGINISERVYGYYETGDRFPNDEKVLSRVADYFSVSVDYLLGKTDIRTPYSADEFETIAAHHEGEWTEEDLQDIEDFKEFIRSKKRKEK